MKSWAWLVLVGVAFIISSCGLDTPSNTDTKSDDSSISGESTPPDITGYVMDQKQQDILVITPLYSENEHPYTAMWLAGAPGGRWVGKQVEVWVKNEVQESFPARAEADQVSLLEMSEVEGADLEASQALAKALKETEKDQLVAVKMITYLEEEDQWKIEFSSLDGQGDDFQATIADR